MKLVVEATSPEGGVITRYVDVSLSYRLLDQYSQEIIEAKISKELGIGWEITDVRLPRETVGMENERRPIYNGCDTIGAI